MANYYRGSLVTFVLTVQFRSSETRVATPYNIPAKPVNAMMAKMPIQSERAMGSTFSPAASRRQG